MQHHFLKSLIHDFEEDPATQVKFHWIMMIFWMINALAGLLCLLLWPSEWVKIGVFYVFLLSIYANWDTDYGAVSAAQASLHSEYLVTEHDKETVQVEVEQIPNGTVEEDGLQVNRDS